MSRRKQLLKSLVDREAEPEISNRSLDRMSAHAEIWGAVALGAAAVGGAAMQANAAKNAAKAGQQGADAATAESSRQYDQTRNDLAPYRSIGGNALDTIASLYGWAPPSQAAQIEKDSQPVFVGDTDLPPGTYTNPVGKGWHSVHASDGTYIGNLRPGGANGRFTPVEGLDLQPYWDAAKQRTQQASAPPSGGPNMSAFFTSPDYTFRRDEGTRGIERSAAARGGAFSGNALRALNEFNSNLASSEYGNFFNRLASIAGIGQTSTNQTAAYGADHANTASRNALYAGESRASGIIGQSNAIADGVNGIAGAVGYFNNSRRVPQGYGGTGYGGGRYPDLTMGGGIGGGVRYA